MKSILLLIIGIVIFLLAIFTFFYTDEIIKTKDFERIKTGMTMRESHRIMRNIPKAVRTFRGEFMEIYYPLAPINKYILFYNKKDSLIIRTWKEY